MKFSEWLEEEVFPSRKNLFLSSGISKAVKEKKGELIFYMLNGDIYYIELEKNRFKITQGFRTNKSFYLDLKKYKHTIMGMATVGGLKDKG